MKGGECYMDKYSKYAIYWTVSAIVLALAFIGFYYLGVIDYNYQYDKCNSLNSNSYYNFDLTLETNAEYSQRCYHLQNHPLAEFEYTLLLPLVGLIFVLLAELLIFLTVCL